MPLHRAACCLLCISFPVLCQKMFTNYSSREAETGMKAARIYVCGHGVKTKGEKKLFEAYFGIIVLERKPTPFYRATGKQTNHYNLFILTFLIVHSDSFRVASHKPGC